VRPNEEAVHMRKGRILGAGAVAALTALATAGAISFAGVDWEPASDGKFGADDGTDNTVILGAPNNGVFIQGANGPTCSFSGYVVKEVAAG
jgi:hypothetical protein